MALLFIGCERRVKNKKQTSRGGLNCGVRVNGSLCLVGSAHGLPSSSEDARIFQGGHRVEGAHSLFSHTRVFVRLEA